MKDITDAKLQRANANRHTQRGMGQLEHSIQQDGWIGAITVAADGETFDGSARIEVGAAAGFDEAIVVRSRGDKPIIHIREDIPTADDPRAVRLGIAANRVAQLNLDWSPDLLAELREQDGILDGLFRDDELAALLASLQSDGAAGSKEQAHKTLAEQFIVPPFSVLDARQGYWQERKRAWISLGIQSELGRGEGVTWGTSDVMTDASLNLYRKREADNGLLGKSEQARSHYAVSPGGSPDAATRLKDGKKQRGDGAGKPISDSRAIKDHAWPATHLDKPQSRLTWVAGDRPVGSLDETSRKNLAAGRQGVAFGPEGNVSAQSGTSIFDPVLCELVYRWFCPPSGFVLDPFAGGSVRGIVASRLGLHYAGVDLSAGQIEANRQQAREIVPDNQPAWAVGDSKDVKDIAAGEYDLVFSCPPYGDLEVYSDDPRDLSTMKYPDFLVTYREIIAASVAMLKEHRFACFTVGDIRDGRGLYRNFVSDTISAFHDAGARLYNEAILVTAVGSLPIRVGKQFSGGRKLGKTHQNVLVFVKGDAKKAAYECGPVEVPDLAAQYGEVVAE